ncbi:Sterol uptake control 2 [Fusarium albosuccineum]|uniref:Sterol uptake control 2 n=1 Tax=Fusarium albosuccineum TaxID=1237068 RepID=A0A8H4LHT1_9HYPO|nr:Sterol uptake control 2 [Fusarium albosuccineum]
MEPDRPRKPRQGHRKSRNGCAVCKKRHIKCDERRPKCGNCEISERQCFYVSPKKAKVGASPYEQELTTSAWLQTASTSSDEVVVASPDLHSLEPDDLFTFEHLNLLYHVQENITEWMMVTEQLKPLANVYVTAALKTPYLMNQLLALSAMNLRTIDKANSDSYTQAATHLRHRALRGFNRASHRRYITSKRYLAVLLRLAASPPLPDGDGQSRPRLFSNFAMHIGILSPPPWSTSNE